MKFTSNQHESNFLDLMVMDNTYHDDKERQSLWYIIAGDTDLYRKRSRIYDFADHSIKHCLDDGSVDLCSSGRALVRLGFNLYNNYKADGLSPCELFWNLDSHSMSLALVKPIKVRVGNLAGLREVLEYVKNSDKTENEMLVYTKDLLKGMEFQQMVNTKRLFRKNSGRQYAHFVQSFDPKDDVSPELAYEIGQEFIRRFERFNNFQVVMAVHTNEPQMHAHYIINSVSPVDGCKWQSAPQDLVQMRAISDDLCREHGLSVTLHGHSGHRSYGEYTAQNSWKWQLAQGIAEALSVSHSRADFRHRMDEKGIDVDFAEKSILFTIPKGVYGLQAERKCSNSKLLSYGDFSIENINATWKCNKQLANIGREDMQTMQDVLLELGQLHFPDSPDHYQEMYLRDIPFDGLTKQEIEIALSRKALETMLAKARQAHEKAEAERRQSGLLLATMVDTLVEVLHWQEEQHENIQFDSYCYSNEIDSEFEL